MSSSKSLIISIIGFCLSIYGGFKEDSILLVAGILVIFLDITFILNEQEEDIKILKAQINTQNELKRLREEINQIKRRENE